MPTPLKLGGHSLGSVQSHYILVVVVIVGSGGGVGAILRDTETTGETNTV